MHILLTLTIAYALLVLAAALFQRRLIYFPTRLTLASATHDAAQKAFEPWRNARGEVIGWKRPATDAPTGSVLVVHGNAGSAMDRDYLARPVHDATSVDVFILEYPGYGVRAGSPSMSRLLSAADEAFDLLPVNLPRYVVGESLGSGVAAHLAKARGTAVAGVLLFMPYDNLAGVAQSAMPFLPASLILRDRFAPDRWLAEYRGPLMVVLAERDEVIPARFGRRLYEGYGGRKKLEICAGAGHNDCAGQSAQWWKQVFSFWEGAGR